MKRAWMLGLAAVALLAAPAMAADATPNWNGCYVGANAGYGWNASNSSYRNDPNTTGDPINHIPSIFAIPPIFVSAPQAEGSGLLGGVGAGCNLQAHRWVLGIEGDLDGAEYSGSGRSAATGGPTSQVQVAPNLFTNNPGLATASEQVALQWLSTIRGRVGFLAHDRLLLYVTGGLAIGDVHAQGSVEAQSTSGTIVGSWGGSSTAIRTGYVVGAGGEWAVAGPWFVKLEYLRFDLGTINHPLNCTSSPVGCNVAPFFVYPTIGTTTAPVRGNIVRVGVNFRFD